MIREMCPPFLIAKEKAHSSLLEETQAMHNPKGKPSLEQKLALKLSMVVVAVAEM